MTFQDSTITNKSDIQLAEMIASLCGINDHIRVLRMPCEISYVRYKSTQVFAIKAGQIAISSRKGLCPIDDLESFSPLTTLRSVVIRDSDASLQSFAQSRTKQESPTAYYVIGTALSNGEISQFVIDTIKEAIVRVDSALAKTTLVNGYRKGYRNGDGFRSSLKEALRGFDIISSEQLSEVELEPIIKRLLVRGHNVTKNDLKALLAAQSGKSVSLIKAQIRSDARVKNLYSKYLEVIEPSS